MWTRNLLAALAALTLSATLVQPVPVMAATHHKHHAAHHKHHKCKCPCPCKHHHHKHHTHHHKAKKAA